MLLHQIDRPLTKHEVDKTYKRALGNLQATLLKGHGRDNTAHIFLEFNKGKQKQVKEWLSHLAGRVTSMDTQLVEQQHYNDYRLPGKLITCVYLTAAGYRYLGYSTGKFDSSFRAGMKKARVKLGDPGIGSWDKGFGRTIHVMIMLADDGPAFVGREAHKVLKEVKHLAKLRRIELGAAQRNANNQVIEHFGYADGVSQPILFQVDVEKAVGKEGITIEDLKDGWDPGAGPKLVLVPDPLVDGNDAYGSYFVFRKLEQNVFRFKLREKELAVTLQLMGEDMERAGALAVGRFEDGNPVVLDDDDQLPENKLIRNNFNYHDDPLGAKCPLQSHIRKVNPRGSTGNTSKERRGRILRMGITYGVRTDQSFENEDVLPSEGIGLLFMCYQADLALQFEHMQQKMANAAGFPKAKAGIDPIIGQGGKGKQQWPKIWGKPDTQPFPFHGFVKMKGGDYFFAPRLPFLKSLK